MRKFFKVLLIIVAGLVIIVGMAAIFIATRSIPTFKAEQPVVKIEYTPQRVEQGAKLAGMLCRNCHYDNSTRKFTGGQLTEVRQFGKIYAKNITQHPEAGIGKWTDSELVYFIRTGIRPDGQYVPPYMPKLVHISDEDLYSIIAFLRSDNSWVAPDAKKQPATEPSFLTKFLLTIKAFEPFPYPANPIQQPDTTNPVSLGKYVSLYQLECFACHSQDFAKNDYFAPEKSPGFFAGGNKLYNKEGQELHSLNITMHEKNGIGKWSEDEFVKAVKYGQIPNNAPALRYPMSPYSLLTDKEAKAIFAYLKTIPKLDNKVERKFQEQ
jgi:cytochrome c2